MRTSDEMVKPDSYLSCPENLRNARSVLMMRGFHIRYPLEIVKLFRNREDTENLTI